MMTALSFHVGEVQRNPYHLLVPAWMQDNVRRGGELVGGQGGAAPDFVFCTLYRLRRWSEGQLRTDVRGRAHLPAGENASTTAHMSVDRARLRRIIASRASGAIRVSGGGEAPRPERT